MSGMTDGRAIEIVHDLAFGVTNEFSADELRQACEHVGARLREQKGEAVADGVTPVFMVCNAYESGYGKGQDGRERNCPHTKGRPEHEAWLIGYDEGAKRAAEPQPAPITPAPIAGGGLFELRALADQWRHAFDGNGHDMAGANKNTIRRFIEAIDSLSSTAAPAPVAGWVLAADTELVNTHLGVANADDDFETARGKLSELIQWHIDVSHDPRVNGAPVAGDAVLTDAEWMAHPQTIEAKRQWNTVAEILRADRDDPDSVIAAAEVAALAQDRASQPSGGGVPEGWKLVPERMALSAQDIENIITMTEIEPDADDLDDRFGSGGVLIVGTIGGEGTGDPEVYGLHIYSAEYPDEGCTTLVEFAAAPAAPETGGEVDS